MDPLSAWLRKRTQRRVALAAAGVLAAIAVGILTWKATRTPAPLPPATDARIEQALAREAARALREGPREAPPALEGAGLRALGEHWSPRAAAAPPARWTPAPLTPGRLASPRDRAPAPRGIARVKRALPERRGDPAAPPPAEVLRLSKAK